MADQLSQGPSPIAILTKALNSRSLAMIGQACVGHQWWLVERHRNEVIWALKEWEDEMQGHNNPWAVRNITLHGPARDKERVWVRVRDPRGYWQGLHLDSIPCDEQLRSIYGHQLHVLTGV